MSEHILESDQVKLTINFLERNGAPVFAGVVEALRAQLAEEQRQHRMSREDAHSLVDKLESELAALQERMAEAERQEPVAARHKNGTSWDYRDYPDVDGIAIAVNEQPLYARPVPAAVPDVADVAEELLSYLSHIGFSLDADEESRIRAMLEARPKPAAVPDAVAKDAARYRWIRQRIDAGDVRAFSLVDYPSEDEDMAVDAEIDSMLAAAQKSKP